MTVIDVTGAVDAMARAYAENIEPGSYDRLPPFQRRNLQEHMLALLAPGLPSITEQAEAAVAAATALADVPRAPWPIVGECHSWHRPEHSCPQCDGGHEHRWIAWHEAPETRPGSGTRVIGGQSGPGVPVRCATCGARKCDTGNCRLRRHHVQPQHEEF